MKRHTTCLALALVTTLAIAGCGKDNNDNSGPRPTTAGTATPGGRTATPGAVTPTGGGATATPGGVTATPGGATATAGGPTASGPVPTATPGGGGGGGCDGATSLSLKITSAAGSTLDTGWTGISHGQPALEQAQTIVDLDCTSSPCVVHGESLAGTKFGSPLPLAAGGVGVCVINTFREGVTGTYDCATGCGESAVKLTSTVIQAANIAKPCPNCVGDPTPNDAQKGGTCDSGATPGAACDVGGTNPVFGPTSNDCLPSGSGIGNLAIDITPLTTGTVSLTGNMPCGTARFGSTCFVPGQDRPNGCVAPEPAGTCPASGVCDDPVDTFCSGQTFQTCFTPGSMQECEGQFGAGAGTCSTFPRHCFVNTITRTGVCGTQGGTLVGIFNIPPTSAPAINTVSGLPGPGAVSLPVTTVRTPK